MNKRISVRWPVSGLVLAVVWEVAGLQLAVAGDGPELAAPSPISQEVIDFEVRRVFFEVEAAFPLKGRADSLPIDWNGLIPSMQGKSTLENSDEVQKGICELLLGLGAPQDGQMTFRMNYYVDGHPPQYVWNNHYPESAEYTLDDRPRPWCPVEGTAYFCGKLSIDVRSSPDVPKDQIKRAPSLRWLSGFPRGFTEAFVLEVNIAE
ncbi:MAG: hypothetical protein LBF65_00810 [Holosporales bacterium]|jgi:hypothetical protein|nr:hypothetical protein [Holosporales bacterium]